MALVVSRKQGESVRIGDNIVITVSNIDRNKIHLAIEAPKEILILRSELLKRNENVNRNNTKSLNDTTSQECRNVRRNVD